MNLLSLITIILYLGAASLHAISLSGRLKPNKIALLLGGLIAVLIHAYLLHVWIDIPTGQNLSGVNLFSLAAWLAAVLLIIAAFTKPIENLCLLVFPIAALSIILVLLLPQYHVINTAAQPGTLIHVLLSIIVFSILCIAALQAILLIVQERALRHNINSRLIDLLPPLQTMEALLFQVLIIGFVLFTLLGISSFFAFGNIFMPPMLGKTVVVLLAWIIFLILLLGHYYFGWRGKVAIRFTLVGVALLTIAYYGTQFLVA